MPNPKTNSDSKISKAESKNSSFDSKISKVESKNSFESKINKAESKNQSSTAKNNDNPDIKNTNNDSKTNNPDPKTSADAHTQGDGSGGNLPPPAATGQAQGSDSQRSRNGNKVYKSGPLFLSSKGIGWTSWKKRWFILTQTSLVFFRSDPNAATQKGGEVNLTLGGIDLNSSGSVVVKADKKLLTVLFPDGRDGRAFTLKAETSEDLFEWKTALEEALANAPSAGTGMSQNGILKNEKGDATDGSQEQAKDRAPPKSIVIGRPILLALEDIDGTPSFLEKALRYVEEHGVKVEGILRQAADVDDVMHRIREYEQGKMEFTAEEDAHVIGDCIKYVLRELPSSPVPASCCNALLQAFRTDRANRVNAMRAAICDTFPEPNRRLLQRILMMMETVAENKAVNRMSVSAVAACMAPLLLRPLLAGECDLGKEFDMGGDGSVQLLQAAAAANHAQAIIITLLEEYDNIFGEGDMVTDLYSDSEESGSESEELSDDEPYEDDEDEEEGEYTSEGSQVYEDSEHASSVTGSETGDEGNSSHHHSKGSRSGSSHSGSHDGSGSEDIEESEKLSSSSRVSQQQDNVEESDNASDQSDDHPAAQATEPDEHSEDETLQLSTSTELTDSTQRSIANGPGNISRRPTVWGRTGAKKNLSMENVDVLTEEEAEILRLEAAREELKEKIEAEARENAILKEDLLSKKNALAERRRALEQDVASLQDQLQKERELRKTLEAGLKMAQAALPLSDSINGKTKADLEEIAKAEVEVSSLKQKADALDKQLHQQREQNSNFARDSGYQLRQSPKQKKSKDKDKDHEGSSRKMKESRSRKEHGDKQQLHSFSTKGPETKRSSSKKEMSKSSSTNSKKSSSKGESASTSSALSKLTNRLNFLKERRNQIANELQNIDKERSKSQKQDGGSRKGSDSSIQLEDSDDQSSEKGKGSESHYQGQNNRGVTTESSFQHTESLNKQDNQSLQTPLDKGRRSEDQKGRSEDQSNTNTNPDKGESRTHPR